ncbi:hypothetical protein [Aquimarina litoralis]|uniref:hypothetical protein n=1 Tax=Aquimarina litoralis TaxID=584605 RepID=UPI001C5A1AC2|nr:hypothetical protein [Aquimarina litoralis]MBW1297909.1 hypothetical protein [Aquimarina litoralis]
MKPEILHRIKIPIIADSVLSPQVHYGNVHHHEPITGIYFNTQDEHYGRITFENFDSLKVCRGEMLPIDYDWETHERGVWIFKVENSQWLVDRYTYEKKHYGGSYEFGGDVEEMKTHFNHYIFSFHDQFVEVISRGFWFEKSDETLFGKPLQKGHPFLTISDMEYDSFEEHTLTYRYWVHKVSIEELVHNAQFCTQTLMEFALELDGKARVDHRLTLTLDEEGNVMTHLCGYFGNKQVTFPKIANIEDVKPYLKKYMKEVFDRRQKMKK